jgi:uncharacterized protein (DUF2249 family)
MSEPIRVMAEGVTGHGGCNCGSHDDATPVLDVRTIPHSIRHAAIFGAFDSIAPGGSMVIVAPHAPVPILEQLRERAPIETEYLVEGPTEWHVKITRLRPVPV